MVRRQEEDEELRPAPPGEASDADGATECDGLPALRKICETPPVCSGELTRCPSDVSDAINYPPASASKARRAPTGTQDVAAAAAGLGFLCLRALLWQRKRVKAASFGLVAAGLILQAKGVEARDVGARLRTLSNINLGEDDDAEEEAQSTPVARALRLAAAVLGALSLQALGKWRPSKATALALTAATSSSLARGTGCSVSAVGSEVALLLRTALAVLERNGRRAHQLLRETLDVLPSS